MKILLIEQLRKSNLSSNRFLTRFLTSFSILPTLYIRRLAAITPGKHKVTILNERYHQRNITDEYDLVVIHYNTASSSVAYKVADQYRKKNVCVILCGLHASALTNEALKHADTVLLGRGECNWLDLLKDAEKKKIQKIYPPKSLDTEHCHLPSTNVRLPGFVLMGAIEATRGCPYQCHFCPEGNTPNGNHFYTRPVEEVIEEIRNLPQKIFMFYDMSLTIDPSYTKELFRQMKPLKKHFFCNGNINLLARDPSFVSLSKEAGCIGWLVGFESFQQQTLDSMGKSTNMVKEYETAIDLIHSHNMIVIGDFMFGFDTDTPDVFDVTFSMLKKLKIDVADFTIVTPFPGTPLFKKLQKENRLLTTKWDEYTMFNPVFQPKHMTPEQLQRGVFSLYKQFYSPKEVIQRTMPTILNGIYPFSSVAARNLLASFNSMFLTK
ncbi:MAG: B12-binding domain-containing radical SAM protein [Candidatus Thermoplasmatota archaeon]|nr:B12-binding domain-containing radical SAM protein [Candidatus Thermoplasmatota archaeon]